MDPLNRQEPEALRAAMEAYQATKRGLFSVTAINSYAIMPVVDFQPDQGKAELEKVLSLYAPRNLSVENEFIRSVYSSADKSSVLICLRSTR
jgi:hypothetical protein